MRKTTMWFQNRPDTNRAVLAQKVVGNFGFRKKRNCTIRVVKTKALIGITVTAKLRSAPLVSHMQIVDFLMTQLILFFFFSALTFGRMHCIALFRVALN